MSQIIPSYQLVLSKTLDLQGYLKYQHFSPPFNKGVKLTIEHNQKKSIRSGRSLIRSQNQRRTRLMNIGLCNLIHCDDGFLKFWTYTTKKPCYDKRKITRNFTDFIRRFQRVLGYKPIYIAVLEQHNSANTSEGKRYSYHIHCLFFNIPYFEHSKMTDIWGLGHTWIIPIPVDNGYMGLCYVLKYLTKENTLNDRVMMSRTITRPIVYYNLDKPHLPSIYEYAIYVSEADVTIKTSLHKK